MRLVIQRVDTSSVSVKGEKLGEIDKGLLILVGVGEGDEKKDANDLARKVSGLRILSDNEDKMNLSVLDKNQKVLAISQFTLYADTKKGNRPSFVKAADPEKAELIYNHFVEALRREGVIVETGRFGEYMNIDASLDGPVTIVMDSSKK